MLIHFIDQELTSLTDLWKAGGSVPRKKPAEWLLQEGTDEFIQQITGNYKSGISNLLQTRSGRIGGTFAHWKIALACAEFLSPKIRSQFMDIIKARYLMATSL